MQRSKRFVFKWLILHLFLFVFSGTVTAQISDRSVPESFNLNTKSSEVIPVSVLDSVKIKERISEDKSLGIPNRFGVIQEINVDIREQGAESQMGDVNIWRYEITCPDAVSMGVFFENYYLPDGARVYVYSPDGEQIMGGFTSVNNKVNNQLKLAGFPGNELIIEYDEPVDAEFPGELVIGSVSTAYADLKSVANDWVPINCTEGEDWQDEKRSVCLITFDEGLYTYYCSGALVNNVREDQTPYFLTANHCISSNSVAKTLVAYFNYENSTCTSNDAELDQSLSGAELKATNSYSDFTLLELTESPPDDYLPYFSGWNASDDDPSEGTCIHHPEGSYKCIAIDYDAPTSYPYLIQWDGGGYTRPNTHWEVYYDVGTDESGSSGSPLYDENKRVIGQLHGGDENSSLFGKISKSWDYSSNDTGQLKIWLDPDDTGTLRLDGLDYNAPPSADFTADVSLACLNTTVYFTDESTKSPDEWLWKFEPGTVEFVNGTDENSQNPKVLFTAEGAYSVTLIASNEEGKDTVTYENLIEAVANLNVTFPDFQDEVTVCGYDLTDYLMVADGANEYDFEVSEADNFDVVTSGDSLLLTLKDEVRQYGSFDTYVKVTGSHGSCTSSDSVWMHVVMPENDDIENAIALNLGENAYYSNECGTTEDNEPSPFTLDNSIWFTFQGTSSGKVSIEASGFDTDLAVYEADSYAYILLGDYTLLASGTTSVLEDISVQHGKTYWLQVDGENGDYGELSLNLISNTIEVYPNPSSGIFNLTVSTKDEGDVEVDVFTVNGQRIYKNTFSLGYDSNTITMDLSGVSDGMYLFRARINGISMSKKIIVAH